MPPLKQYGQKMASTKGGIFIIWKPRRKIKNIDDRGENGVQWTERENFLSCYEEKCSS